jgi:hypothetical protein
VPRVVEKIDSKKGLVSSLNMNTSLNQINMNFGSSRCKSLTPYANQFQLLFGEFLLVIKVKQNYTNDVPLI